MPAPKKVIIRTDQAVVEDIPKVVMDQVAAVTSMTPGTKIVSASVQAEKKHIIHYERRMEALRDGAFKLADGIELKDPGRAHFDARLKEIHDSRIAAIEKIESDHQKKLDDKGRAKLINTKVELELKINAISTAQGEEKEIKLKEKTQLTTEESQQLKDLRAELSKVQAKIDIINKEVGDIGPYQDELQKYFKEVKKLLHEQAYIPESKIKKALGRAEEYAEMLEGRPPLCTITRFDADPKKYPDGVWLVQVEVPQDPLSEAQKIEILEAAHTDKKPQWFMEMSDYEKKLFLEAFKEIETIEQLTEKVPAISSKLRSIPGVANFSRHTTLLIDDAGTVISRNELSRSSHVASRDMKNSDLRAKTTEDNINHVIDNMLYDAVKKQAESNLALGLPKDTPIDVPVLMQTLITPLIPGKPDAALMKDRDAAIARILANNPERKMNVTVMVDGGPQIREFKVNVQIFGTNHALNEFRYYGAGTGTSARKIKSDTPDELLSKDPNKHDMQRIAKFARQYMKDHPGPDKNPSKDYPVLLPLVMQFEKVLAVAPSSMPDKEIYLSALEQLIVKQMNGIPYGSCVSGKDRKGMATIYVDAMQQYIDLYNKIPPIAPSLKDNTDRENFVRLFAKIYVTDHQHANAGQNAKGSDGLKTPLFYLPRDILIGIIKETLNRFIHTQCDRLASNNEVKSLAMGAIKKIKKSISNKLKSAASIFSHSPGETKEAKDALTNEEKSSSPRSNSEAEQKIVEQIESILSTLSQTDDPLIKKTTGFKKLQECFKKADNNKPLLHDLAVICLQRIEDSDKERPSLKIYQAIVDLARNPDSASGKEILDDLHNKSKLAYSSKNILAQNAAQQATVGASSEAGSEYRPLSPDAAAKKGHDAFSQLAKENKRQEKELTPLQKAEAALEAEQKELPQRRFSR